MLEELFNDVVSVVHQQQGIPPTHDLYKCDQCGKITDYKWYLCRDCEHEAERQMDEEHHESL